MEKPNKKDVLRRNIFTVVSITALVLSAVLIALILSIIFNNDDNKEEIISSDITSIQSSQEESTQEESSEPEISSEESTPEESTQNKTSSDAPVSSSEPKKETPVEYNLDPTFTNLLLVNLDNPLPENYDDTVKDKLVNIEARYSMKDYAQIHGDIYPYLAAMVATAQSEGVNLKVLSPYRSRARQVTLFNNQVAREGGDEAKAATVVARPGTSEHNTGLCADFNSVSNDFQNTPMYRWMAENAENYGFVLRYREDKMPITGIIHESWHWRFVGINAAKEMNKLDMCLEEYVEYLGKQKSDN